jgi:uncharacterized membrane protein YcaP (DUF421 family)
VDDVQFWWDGWEPIVRILLLGTLGYATLIALLRISGQRTLATMTPFDFVITVTIGSAFGRVLTASEVPVSEMLVTFALLVALQWIVALLRERHPTVRGLVDREPVMLYHRGQVNERALKRHRLQSRDLFSAARENGLGSLDQAEAVVLQADGSFAVITPQQVGDGSALAIVQKP